MSRSRRIAPAPVARVAMLVAALALGLGTAGALAAQDSRVDDRAPSLTWGGRTFSTEQALRRFVTARGVAWPKFVRLHPAAMARLRRLQALPSRCRPNRGGCATTTTATTSPPAQQLGTLLPPRLRESSGGTYYIAPSGSDATGDGSAARPWQTPGKAFASVPVGSRILARGGRYALSGDHAFRSAGTPERVTTLESYPGERALFDGGRILVSGGSYLRLRRFDLRNQTPDRETLKVTEGAHHVDVDGLLVFESAGQGLLVTKGASGAPYAIQVWNSEFRDNGTSSQYDHGIYVGALQPDVLTGAPSVIANTLIRGSKGYGIQAYPDSNALLITGTTIDGQATKSALVIGGSGSAATANSRVVGSLLTNNREFAVRVNWEGPVGAGNVVAESLAAGNGASTDYQAPGGVTYSDVVENVDPQYVDRAAGDFRLRSTSPARTLVSSNLGYLPATDLTGAPRATGCAGAFCAPAA